MDQGFLLSKKILRVILWTLFIGVIVLYTFPLFVTFANSFMSQHEVSRNYSTQGDALHPGRKFIEMNLIPEKVTLSQYSKLLLETPIYLNMFWNSVKMAFPVVLGNLIVSSMAAYAFTVLRFKRKELLFFIYIIVMLLPQQVTLMPNYLVADWFHMTDHYLAIILPGIFHPFGVFLLRQFMKTVPEAYIESAKMDGAGHVRIFLTVILPMVKAGLAAAAMLTLMDYWNLIDQAVIFIRDDQKLPLSLFLARINEEQIGFSFAGACFYAAPIMITLFYGQDYLKKGIGLSGIKG